MNVHALFDWKSAKLTSRSMAVLAMLCALYTALGFFAINPTPTLKIGFSFLALAISCALFGFWPNVIFAIIADFLGWVVHPVGAYVPFFALILIVKALIYSVFFYKKKPVRIPQILAAEFLAALICNVLLNPLLLTVLILIVKALIYSVFFYKKKPVRIPQILAAEFLAALICNVLLNPLLLTVMYQMPYWVLVGERLLKNLILYPIDCLLLYLCFKALAGLPKSVMPAEWND